jgi:hypothetical protein
MTTPQTSAPPTSAFSPEQLGADLAQFTGTEHYYRHPLARRVVFTDGVKYFADTVGAYWLLDILATELPKHALKHGIIFIDCVVKNGKAALSARTDAGRPNLWERAIDFTDCPEGGWHFYMAGGGPDDAVVIMLPSEY